MPEGKLKVYNDQEVAAKIQADRLDAWTLEDGWLRRKYNTDGWPTTLMLAGQYRRRSYAVRRRPIMHADLSVTYRASCGSSSRRIRKAGSQTRTSPSRKRSRTSSSGAPSPAVRSRERPTSSFRPRNER